MVRRFICLLSALLSSGLLSLAQEFEFTELQRIPGLVNSSAEESMPMLFSKRLYFTRAFHPENTGGEHAGLDVWTSDFKNGKWTRAANTFPYNNKNHNVVVGINHTGNRFYYVDISPSKKLQGVYVSRYVGSRWGEPDFIPIAGVNNLDFLGVYIAPTADVILLSMKAEDSRGQEDLYYAVKDRSGLWSTPKNLGATINTTGFEISPFLSKDNKRLYFASNGHGGEGDADIFYSDRLYDSWETWSTPVNLGKQVNSKKFDAYFSVYGDSVAFFSSNRESTYSDIYTVKVAQQKTILASGQYYLNSESWGSLVGKKVSSSISFPPEITTLTEPQQELIFYIVNKLMLEKDVNFHLVVTEEEKPELTKMRLQAIYDQLTKSGIDTNRIRSEQVASIKKSDKGSIEIRLFK
jgi:hypothetical protein